MSKDGPKFTFRMKNGYDAVAREIWDELRGGEGKVGRRKDGRQKLAMKDISIS